MKYFKLDIAQSKRQKVWQVASISLATISGLLSLELYYLLIKLSDLDIVHFALGICQATALLIFQVITIFAGWRCLKTVLLGVTVISLVFNVGYFIFYCLLELSSIFQIYQGNTNLQPAHPRWWYQVAQLFSASLVVQELLAIIGCIFNFKFRSHIPNITEPEIIPSTSRTEPVVHGMLTADATPKQNASKKIIYIQNNDQGEGISSKLYTYTVAKEESYPEESFGSHQATSYMQDASKMRKAKAKLDNDSVDMSSA